MESASLEKTLGIVTPLVDRISNYSSLPSFCIFHITFPYSTSISSLLFNICSKTREVNDFIYCGNQLIIEFKPPVHADVVAAYFQEEGSSIHKITGHDALSVVKVLKSVIRLPDQCITSPGMAANVGHLWKDGPQPMVYNPFIMAADVSSLSDTHVRALLWHPASLISHKNAKTGLFGGMKDGIVDTVKTVAGVVCRQGAAVVKEFIIDAITS